MKTIVLDDDPTGTQSAADVEVLLAFDADLLARAMERADSVYVQTNSRAIDEASAVELVGRVRRDALEAGERLGEEVRFVLRGDSTLRGHVFAESEVFLDEDAVLLFVPAFPAGGRTTVGGIHYVAVAGERVPAADTEYAQDPVFPFRSSRLADYVREKSARAAVPIPLGVVRGAHQDLADAIVAAPAGTVIVPDAETDDDVRRIARAVEAATAAGTRIVVRCAAPLAAALARVESRSLLPRPLLPERPAVLLACGSHTGGATAQLAALAEQEGSPVVIDTELALTDPVAAGHRAAAEAAGPLAHGSLAAVTSERVRRPTHNTLRHGEQVMTALTTAVRDLLPSVDVVIAKGGITSAEVARVGLGATSATVLGQVAPGISVWRLVAVDGRERLYVVVPGNVGGPDALVDVLDALQPKRREPPLS
ncbi:MAG: hypothetical protein QOE37_915 [Microbacteriaceae bacterium]|nr:hypothetical protein [Microbacteriaceae bacterium]